MNPEQATAIYLAACGAWDRPHSDDGADAYVIGLADVDPAAGRAALAQLIREDRPHMPRAGELRAMVSDILGETPPSLDAAVGLYLSGRLDHPAVGAVAASCKWDRHAAPKDAMWEFRSLYAAYLHQLDQERLTEPRVALGLAAPPAAALPVVPAPNRPPMIDETAGDTDVSDEERAIVLEMSKRAKEARKNGDLELALAIMAGKA